MDTPPIALQLYSLRNLDLTFAQQCEIAAQIGFRAVEFVAAAEIPDADTAKATLNQQGLSVTSVHTLPDLLDEHFDEFVAFCRTLGTEYVVFPIFPVAWLRENSAAGWKAVGRETNDRALRLEAAGLRLGYHNHLLEMAEVEGRRALDWVFDECASNVWLELDIAHVERAGRDPLMLLEDYQGRCLRLHVKETSRDVPLNDRSDLEDFPTSRSELVAPIRRRQEWESLLGDGVTDWEAVLPAAARAGVEWFILELGGSGGVPAIEQGFEFLSKRQNLLQSA